MIPLEDDPCDVIGKAMRGHRFHVGGLARAAGVSVDAVQKALDGAMEPSVLTALAEVLNLDAKGLINLPDLRPEVNLPANLKMFTSRYGHAGVNAFLLVHGKTATAFDAGTDGGEMQRFLDSKNIALKTVYITHRHSDHTAGLGQLDTVRVVYPEDLNHGDKLTITPEISVRVLDVSGHYCPAVAYDMELDSVRACVVGDSVFAGSIGGAPSPERYRQAIKTATESVMSLPNDCIICTGHGPLTTVGIERKCNPVLNRCLP